MCVTQLKRNERGRSELQGYKIRSQKIYTPPTTTTKIKGNQPETIHLYPMPAKDIKS